MGHYIKVSELPLSIQHALGSAGYGRKDIEVVTEEKFEPRPPSGKGRRGFTAACKLDDSNSFEITWGSWGGSNMFTKTIDDVDEIIEIPFNIAFVRGMGSGGTSYPAYATIHVSPKNMNPTLLPAKASVTEREAKILCIYARIRGGYRKEYLSQMKATEIEVTSLVERKFLSRNKAGAISVTTDGRNAAGKDYY